MSVIGNKRNKEIEVGRVFTNRYNKTYKKNYIVKIDEEDRDFDCVMESENNKIGLQITTYDVESIKNLVEAHKHPWEVTCCNPEYVKCIKTAIFKKNNWIKNNAFLLIRSNSLIWFNHDYIKEETEYECSMSNYKKIYLVKLPNTENCYPKNKKDNWDIIELK